MSSDLNVNIDSLIKMAQDYVKSRGVDKDRSESINNDTELNMLLAGTGADSIEDLTIDNIREKLVKRDTEKIFTTFMATDNQEQAELNELLLRHSISAISDNYDELIDNFKHIELHMDALSLNLERLEDIFNEGVFGQEDLNDVVDKLKDFQMLLDDALTALQHLGERYEDITRHKIPKLIKKEILLRECFFTIDNKIDKLKAGSVPIEQIKDEIKDGTKQVVDTLLDIHILREQYEEQKDRDIEFCKKLLCSQVEFANDDIDEADKQDFSKFLLSALINHTSPMTRNFIIEQAEKAYKPENDPTTTGISQPKDASNIKRSSYKTQDEIYSLRGDNVFVTDYSGRVLRTEKLDPEIHKGFFE